MSENKIIKSLYEHYKNTPKKLKIVCDWDEVIQTTEPYCLSRASEKMMHDKEGVKCPSFSCINFSEFFEGFWGGKLGNEVVMEYSPYGSGLKIRGNYKELEKEYEKVASFPDFYQQAPFLTIAEDFLKLIKEDKVEKLIFLSTGDERKREVFRETFGKLAQFIPFGKLLPASDVWSRKTALKKNIQLHLISDYYPEIRTKADWIKQNASDFDVVIDDNPNICKSLIESMGSSENCLKNGGCIECDEEIEVIAPHYPAVESQHHKEVLLVENKVGDVKVEEWIV